jgi:hypothetical protein
MNAIRAALIAGSESSRVSVMLGSARAAHGSASETSRMRAREFMGTGNWDGRHPTRGAAADQERTAMLIIPAHSVN